jgi:hypothetical protein
MDICRRVVQINVDLGSVGKIDALVDDDPSVHEP